MAPRWTQIPNQILAEEERKAKAKDWGMKQRIPMAESWAERQRANDPFKRQMSRLEEADAQMGMAPEAETPQTPKIPPYPEMPIEPPAPKPQQPSFMAPTDPNAQLARAEAMQQARRQTVGIKPPVPQPEQPTPLASGLLAGARSITPEQMVLKQAPWEQQVAPIQPSPPPPELGLNNPATRFTPGIPRLGEASREIVPGAAGLGDAAGRAGRALEWYQENVVQPTAGAAFASVIDPTNIKPTQSYDEGWAAQGEKWRRAEEPLPGVKGTIEGALDLTNLVPGPGTFKAGAKAGAQLAKRGLEVAPDALRAAGRGINRAADLANALPAPGLTVEDISKPTSRYYHGTGSAFDTPEPGRFDPNGLYGPGYYMTDSPDVATSYAQGAAPQLSDDALERLQVRVNELRQQVALEGLDSAAAYRLTNNEELLNSELQRRQAGPNVRPIDVPEGLKLFDADNPTVDPQLVSQMFQKMDEVGIGQRVWDLEPAFRNNPSSIDGPTLWNALREDFSPEGANRVLAGSGFDGIRYNGGQLTPLTDDAGKPIEHNALVIFPESLSKIRNALSGTPGGFTSAENALQLGMGAAGATAGYDPNLSAEENAARMALGFVGGAGLTRGALKGGKRLLTEETGAVRIPGKKVKKAAEQVGPNVAQQAQPQGTNTSANPANQTLLDMYTKGPEPEPTQVANTLEQWRRDLVRQATDSLVDLAEFQKQAAKSAGRPLAPDEMLTEIKRLNPDKAAEVHVQEGLQPAIQAVGDDRAWLSTYLTHQDNIDVARAMGGKVENELLSKDIGPVKGTLQGYRAGQRASRLERMQEANALADSEMRPRPYPKLKDNQVEWARSAADRAKTAFEKNQLAAEEIKTTKATLAGTLTEANRAFSGGLKVADSEQALADMATELGPERMATIQQAADQVWGFGQTMLKRKLDSGLITPELYQALVDEYPHYVPTRILDYLKEPMNIPNGKSLSVSDTGLKRNTIEGTTRAREDPLAAMVRLAYDTETLARKNDAFNAFVKLRDMDAEFQTMIREVPDTYTPTNQEAKISGFVKGERRTYVVPKELEPVVKLEANAVIPGLNTVMGVYRALLTSRNPAFLASNSLLDAGAYAIRESVRAGGPQNLPKVMKALAEAYVDAFKSLPSGQYKGDTAEYLKGGGGMFGFFQGTPNKTKVAVEQLGKRSFIDIQSSGDLARTVKDLLTLKPVETIGERIELAPRVASMKLAEARGASNIEAVINGRTVTIDFAQGGNTAKLINQFIPFFNVGVQAGIQPWRAFKENPKAFLGTAVGLLAGPTVAAEAWNRSDSQRAQDYSDVPQYLKEQGIVIMLPGEAPVDGQGNRRPQFVHIRLREFAPFAVLTREAVARALGDEPQEWQELIGSTTGALSPVQGSNPTDWWMSFVPPGVSTGLQLSGNKDTFRDRMIATERGDENASALSKTVGEVTGARPSQVEFLARDLTGGVGNMALAGSDLLTGKVQQGGASSIPVAGGFAGRFVKGNIGGNLEEARQQTLSPESQKIIKEAGIQLSVSPVSNAIKTIPLTVAEQTTYQETTNDLIDQAVKLVAGTAEWEQMTPEAKEAVLKRAFDRVRDIATRYTLQQIGEEELSRRIAKLQEAS